MNRFVSGVVALPSATVRLYLMRGPHLAVRREGDSFQIPTAPAVPGGPGWLYLGRAGEEGCYARQLGPADLPPVGLDLVGMRALFGALAEEDFGIAGRAMALLEWDAHHQFCGRCAQATQRSTEDRSRVCPACNLAAYPRLSPAVICLVEDGDRVLLARGRGMNRFFSCLAGFVEVGETLEETVAREIQEEVGIQVKDVRYFGSQPWPFSNSLMIGFQARYAGGELELEEKEIAEAGWYTVDSLPELPGKISISRALIDDFLRRQGALK